MPVNSTHIEYDKAVTRWRLVNDVIEGQDAVKNGGQKYLPKYPGWNDDKYAWYSKLAYLLNVTRRTRHHLIGAVFRKDPEITVPEQLSFVESNFNGLGQGIEQAAKRCVSEVLATGRMIIYTDHPRLENVQTKEDLNRSGAMPYVSMRDAKSVINWRTESVNGREVLTLVVISELNATSDDGFSTEYENQFRALRLINGVYIQELYTEGGELIETITPTKKDGTTWGFIPCEFVGSEDNTPDVDISPMEELANANIAHYRSIANREASGVIFSQMMLHVDTGGMSIESWNQANPNGITFGASNAVVTNEGGSVNVVQANANNYGSQDVKDKAEEMISVGARLIDRQGANQTAEAARINASSEMSVLDTIVGNVSDAFTKVLRYMADFMGVEYTDDDISFELNKEFFNSELSAQQVMAAIQLADRRDISQSDMRDMLRRGGWIADTRTDEAIDEDTVTDPPI